MKQATMKACFATISILISLSAVYPKCVAQCHTDKKDKDQCKNTMEQWKTDLGVCHPNDDLKLPPELIPAVCQLAIDERLAECQLKAIGVKETPFQMPPNKEAATSVELCEAIASTESVASSAPPPGITVHTGSAGVLNGGHEYTIKAHGRSMQTDSTGVPNSIFLLGFTDDKGIPVPSYPNRLVLNTPTSFNWVITAYFYNVLGEPDVDHINDPADKPYPYPIHALRTMTICSFEDADGNCVADGKPLPDTGVPSVNPTVYFEDSGYGQFYADTQSPERLKYHVIDACNGSNNCDHISQITVKTENDPKYTKTYLCPAGTKCYIYLKYCDPNGSTDTLCKY
jgi:hypothetical protein